VNFYSQDGEAEILVPAMCEEVQAAFQEANTDFVKGPPSATAKHQANDASAAFKHTKAGVAKVTRHRIETSNPTRAAHVREAVAELKVAFPNAIITSLNVAKIVAAVETLSWVMKNGYVTQ
jgi:type II secretory pathway component HofQ